MRIPTGTPGSRPRRLSRSRLDQAVIGAYDGVFAPSFRYPTFSLDRILAEKGYQFVENMLHLAACRAPLNLKRYAVLQDGWSIEAAITDPLDPGHTVAQHLADEVTYALTNIRDDQTDLTQDLRSVLFDMMTGAWTGNRLAEIIWQYQKEGPLKGKHGFAGIVVKPNKQIGFDVDTNTLAVKNFTSYTPGGGYDFDIPVEKCLWYVHNQSANHPQGEGDWRASYKHYLRLESVTKFWAIALERWGAPVMIMSYPVGRTDDRDTAAIVANNIRQGQNPILPDNVKYELVSAPRAVFVGLERAAIWDTQQIALNVNSNILTTSVGQNSLALGKVHQESAFTVYDGLSKDIEEAFTQQVIRRFIRYNYGDAALRICPRLRLRKQPEGNQLQLAQMLQILIEGGNMPSRSKLIRQQLGLPPLDPEEEKMLDTEQQAQTEAQERLADARNSGDVPAFSDAEAEQAVERLKQVVFAGKELRCSSV